ncbi:IS200/IS605 family transposase [Oceanivirga salmonicida]|uniref:IS200/IS605 family transposase n=1 Tax=Oceanivirga salmonicida TaxID=1769291 RepID=UPI0012E1355D|nr:IS200/IS605 family transposase [Oceanivirga salmonicida]
MAEVVHGRGYVYCIQYHIVWCVKYRHKILVDDIDIEFKKIIIELCESMNIKVVKIETDYDHIHILVECSPQHYIPTIMKTLKGVSARYMFKKFPKIKSKLLGGHMWNPTYFVATVSENTEEQIKQYIRNQKVNGK